MTDELMKDAELDAVVGGSGVECMALMSRLQVEGLAKFKTPLVIGNEAAAAQELQAYLDKFKGRDEFTFTIYADDRKNEYEAMAICPAYGEIPCPINADELVKNIRKWQR